MRSTTVRIPEETRDRLNALARRRGSTAGALVAELVRSADEDALLTEAEESWARLGANPAALAAYGAETADLDAFDAPLPQS